MNSNKFNTFKAFKRWLWYNLHTGEIIEGSQIWEDTIYKTYKIKKTERRLIVETTYNLEQEQKKYFENLQLNLFDNENHRTTMDRNHPSYQYSNHCYNYDLMCTVVYNEPIHKQKQSKLNAKNRTNINIKR